MNPVKVTETALRDGHQSLMATRLSTAEILPVAEKMDQAGYYALEVWGGATFDACLRFLHEDPWERLREIRKVVKNTKLQMLLRGQNLLGYRNYADDVVEAFIRKSVENGIDIIRVFDALNDERNLETSMRVIKETGAHCQAALCYTTSEIHTIDYFVDVALKFEAMGADSICIKDMGGIIKPYVAYDLVTRLKQVLKVPLEIHTHQTAGTGSMAYLKAIEAGVDIVDTAISPLGEGTSQPNTETLVMTLQGTDRDTGLNLPLLGQIADDVKVIRDRYRADGTLNPKVMDVEPKAIMYQVPGGMLSNLLSQLKQAGEEDKYEEVLQEVPRVRKDLGYPPLVTPMSQMVGTQSVMNVLNGERYKMIPNEIKDYVRGEYGRSPIPISDEIRHKLIGDDEVITSRPADHLAPELPHAIEGSRGLARSQEDVLSYALFPEPALHYFMERERRETEAATAATDQVGEGSAAVTTAAVGSAGVAPAALAKDASIQEKEATVPYITVSML